MERSIAKKITMKKISFIPIIFVSLLMIGLLSSCYEEDVWLEDNIITTGEYFPVIYMNDLNSEYQADEAVSVVLEYFSLGTLEEIVLYQKVGEEDEEVVLSTPPNGAFSERKAQDTLALTYTVPMITDTVDITLRAEAINANGLTKSSSNSFTAIPAP